MTNLTYPGLDLINKNIMDVITNSENQAECIKALAKKYPSAATITIMELLVEAKTFVSPIGFTGNEVPAVTAIILN